MFIGYLSIRPINRVDAIYTRGFNVTDDTGVVRNVLGVYTNGQPLLMMCSPFAERLTLALDSDSDPILLFRGPEREIRANLGLDSEAPELVFYDEQGNIRAHFGLKDDGSPFIHLLDEFGNKVFSAP